MVDPRLFPEGFLEAYRSHLGGDPPEDFVEAYDLLCDTLYYGTRISENVGKITGGGSRGFSFGEPGLLGFKWAVDARLAALGAQVRHWAARGPREAPGGPRSQDHGGGDLAQARRAWHRRPEPEAEEEMT